MKTRNKTAAAALLFAALMASQAAFAQSGDGSTGSSTGQVTGTAGAKGDRDGSAGTTGSGSGRGTLMQKREQGMSRDQPASSSQSTGKMSQ